MCVSTGGVRRARFYLRMRVHRSGSCIPHTRHIHTTVVRPTYIHGVYEYVLCGVCAHVYGRGYVHVFFSCVHRTRPLTRVYVHRLPSPTEGQLGLVGMHDRAREVHAHLPRKSCTRRMCAFATACTRDEGTKKTGTRQRLNVFRWKAG